jgi:hypothetical protein
VIQDTTAEKLRRLGSSSMGLSSDTLLPDRAIDAWAVGASTDDVSTLSILGRVVLTVGSIADALSLRMVRTNWRL